MTKDEYHAIHENGAPYDDDVGGNAFVGGRGGIELAPIDAKREVTGNKKPQLRAVGVLLLVEAGGIEPPSASPLQAVLHT